MPTHSAMKICRIIFLLLSIWILSNCSRDQLPESMVECDETVTYTNVIKPIIDESCAYTGCHDGAGGIGPADYTRYSGGMLRHLNSGSFKSRTIDQKDNPSLGMPPSQSVYPETIKEELTPDELEMVMCWLENGFPE